MARWIIALLALLLLTPSARADGRFVHAFDAASEIHSTGNGFAWTTNDGHVRVTDARGRILHDVQPGPACHTPSATNVGVALIVCGSADTWLLDARTGALTSRPVPGEAGRIGRFWIESGQGDSTVYTNWHTGEQRTDVAPGRDVNDPELGVAERPYRLRDRRTTILVRRGDRWREVAHCRAACGDILVWLDRKSVV